MTLAEAEAQWVENKQLEDRAKPLKEAAATVLKAHFRKTKRRKFGRVGYSTGSQLRLDNDRVKAELGARLPNFQKVVPTEQLSLIDA